MNSNHHSAALLLASMVAIVAMAVLGSKLAAGQTCARCEPNSQDPPPTPAPERWFSLLPFASNNFFVYTPVQGPMDWIGCRKVPVPNGSFEEGLESWRVYTGSADVLPSDPPHISAQHGDAVLSLTTNAAQQYVGLESALFAPIPREDFDRLRFGVWYRLRGGTTPGGPGTRFGIGNDWNCSESVHGSDATEHWQFVECEETDPDGYYTRGSWPVMLGASAQDDEPNPNMTWLVDNVSVEICLK